MSSLSFFQRLEERVKKVDSLLCVGLDPHPQHLDQVTAEGALMFCLNIIDHTHPFAAAFKPNSAFFESLGPEGMRVLGQVAARLQELDIPIILDVKRGDIGSTAEHYAMSSYETLQADAVTLSPYMGWDSIAPFVTGKYASKGAFILCKTSNPSSKDIQELLVSSADPGQLPKTVYERVAQLCNDWNSSAGCCLGLVAGATDISSLRVVRRGAPLAWLLCPGVGTQGGSLEAACEAGLREDGKGLLVAVSRNISDPCAQTDGKSMGDVARELRDSINTCRTAQRRNLTAAPPADVVNTTAALRDYQRAFIRMSIRNKVLRFGSFTLKSGRVSPYFFNAGLFCGGGSMGALCGFYAQAIRTAGVEFDVLFGPAYKGIPLASGVATAWMHLVGEDKGFTYNRKEVKDHGEGGLMVGSDVAGKRVLIVDDVITAGTAIRESIELLRRAGAHVVAVAVALDREERAPLTGDGDVAVAPSSAVQQVQLEFGIDVISIVRLANLIQFMASSSYCDEYSFTLDDINFLKAYRLEYGINP